MRLAGLMKTCRQTLKGILLGALASWVAAAPLVWILRDGLGPDQIDSGWPWSVFKFLGGWGLPALVLAAPLLALWLVDRPRRIARREELVAPQ